MPLSDEKFMERLTDGKQYEEIIANRLIEAGIPRQFVQWEVLEAGEDGAPVLDKGRDITHFSKHDKDITVNDYVLEVKSRRSTCVFETVDDFPFPDIFLDTEGGWESKKEKPDYYVVVSQDTGGAIVVPGSTRDQWDCRKVYDRACGFATKTLVAPKELAIPFEEMVNEIMSNGCCKGAM